MKSIVVSVCLKLSLVDRKRGVHNVLVSDVIDALFAEIGSRVFAETPQKKNLRRLSANDRRANITAHTSTASNSFEDFVFGLGEYRAVVATSGTLEDVLRRGEKRRIGRCRPRRQ
jgi:hypothetical protein